MPVSDILAIVEQSQEKPLSEMAISDRLEQDYKDDFDGLETTDKADVYAFIVEEGENNKMPESGWTGYFAPIIWQRIDGTIHPRLRKDYITSEVVTYWQKRGKEFTHPLLCARYLGLVFDLQKEITGTPPSFQTAKGYIEALINTVNGGFCEHPSNGFEKLRRALELSIRYRNAALTVLAKQAMLEYESLVGDDDKPGRWGWTIDCLLNEKGVKLSVEEEQGIITGMRNRFDRLVKLAEEDYMKLHGPLIEALKYLRDIYSQRNDTENLRTVAMSWAKIILDQYQQTDPMRGVFWLEELESVLRAESFAQEAEQVMRLIHEHGPKVTESMGVIQTEHSISKEYVDSLVEPMLAGDPADAHMRFALEFLPNKEQSKETMLKHENEHSFLSMLTTEIHNHDRKVTSVRPDANEYSDALAHYLSETIRFGAFWRDRVLRTGEERNIFTAEESIAFLKLSAGISTARLPFFEIAIQHYYRKEFVQFVHIALPQIEQSLREILRAAGGNVLKHSKDGRGHQLRILDDLLRDELMQSIISPDLAFYLQVILSHQCGFNLRNDCLHGLLLPGSFTQQMADLLFHTVMCLGLLWQTSTDEAPTP